MQTIQQFGTLWEHWHLDQQIGRGSFGTVWKARRQDPWSHVVQYAAVKHISIPQSGTGDEDMMFPNDESRHNYYSAILNQLISEIDAMVTLKGKQHIVSYEEHKVIPKPSGEGYDLFLRMELLTGLTAYVHNKGGALPSQEVVRMGIHIADALEVLQRMHLVHRDIKPANLFIDSFGDFKLGDFGTAKVLDNQSRAATRTGTLNYMAPQVYIGSENYDQTVDIYSLGIVLYRFLNKNLLPFQDPEKFNNDNAMMERIKGTPLPPPCDASPAIAQVILKACAFRPQDRYQTARELRIALEEAAKQSCIPDAYSSQGSTVQIPAAFPVQAAVFTPMQAAAPVPMGSPAQAPAQIPVNAPEQMPPNVPVQAPVQAPVFSPMQAPAKPVAPVTANQHRPNGVELPKPISAHNVQRQKDSGRKVLVILLAVILLALVSLVALTFLQKPEDWVCANGHSNSHGNNYCAQCDEAHVWQCSCGKWGGSEDAFCSECGKPRP